MKKILYLSVCMSALSGIEAAKADCKSLNLCGKTIEIVTEHLWEAQGAFANMPVRRYYHIYPSGRMIIVAREKGRNIGIVCSQNGEKTRVACPGFLCLPGEKKSRMASETNCKYYVYNNEIYITANAVLTSYLDDFPYRLNVYTNSNSTIKLLDNKCSAEGSEEVKYVFDFSQPSPPDTKNVFRSLSCEIKNGNTVPR